jgi:cholesterol oxidase
MDGDEAPEVGLPAKVDVLIIGSGFGGSVVAHRLAVAAHETLTFEDGKTRAAKVHLVERGREYPLGSFPRLPHDLKENFWDPSNGKLGMFNLWSFDQLDAVFASGLGGGSLIYANVLLKPGEDELRIPCSDGENQRWPVPFQALEPHLDRVLRELAAERYPYPEDDCPSGPHALAKAGALRKAAKRLGDDCVHPHLAVRFRADDNGSTPTEGHVIDESSVLAPLLEDLSKDTKTEVSGRLAAGGSDPRRVTCRQCAECDIGCNFGSKNTLDHTYLRVARELGVGVHPLHEVRDIEAVGDGGFHVTYVTHDPAAPAASRNRAAVTVTAKMVVVAAGALGSTYLLLKNKQLLPALSGELGTKISGNGDFLGFVTRTDDVVDPNRGPVITTSVRRAGHYLQDGGYPGLLNWLAQTRPTTALEQTLSFARLSLRRNRTRNGAVDHDLSEEAGRIVGSNLAYRHALPLLVMGHDREEGKATLNGSYLDVDWKFDRTGPYFAEIVEHMDDIAGELGGSLSLNPLFERRKRSITAHPLGGCPMGAGPESGVVDSTGRAYGYADLFVVDGSVMPGPIGPNPSLTIAAHASLFAEAICARFLEISRS